MRVHRAGITDGDGALRDFVAGATICGTSINGMRVVGATAGRIYFDYLITHFGFNGTSKDGWMCIEDETRRD